MHAAGAAAKAAATGVLRGYLRGYLRGWAKVRETWTTWGGTVVARTQRSAQRMHLMLILCALVCVHHVRLSVQVLVARRLHASGCERDWNIVD